MNERSQKNVAASVRQRLLNLARERGEDFQLVLGRYALERLIHRLSQSAHAHLFILKGAMLFDLWTGHPHRPTRDLDLLARGRQSPQQLEDVFRSVCLQVVEDDGLEFLPDTVTSENITRDQEYEGVRLRFMVMLERSRIPIQVDVGLGDAVTPAPSQVQYPSMLGFPTPTVTVYPKETVVAEKFQAMVVLGITNSRMKDFLDLWVLSRIFEFDGPPLCRALAATFQRRKTPLPATAPVAFTSDFGGDEAKVKQWLAFLKRSGFDAATATLEEVCAALRGFLMPPIAALVAEEPFEKYWQPEGPWRD